MSSLLLDKQCDKAGCSHSMLSLFLLLTSSIHFATMVNHVQKSVIIPQLLARAGDSSQSTQGTSSRLLKVLKKYPEWIGLSHQLWPVVEELWLIFERGWPLWQSGWNWLAKGRVTAYCGSSQLCHIACPEGGSSLVLHRIRWKVNSLLCVCVSHLVMSDSATQRTVVHQAPLYMEFCRQKY